MSIIPFKQRGNSVYEETMLSMYQLPQEFGLEIIILGCWNIWIQRNGKVFRHEKATIQGWRRNLIQDLKLLLIRMKEGFKPKLQEWMDQQLS